MDNTYERRFIRGEIYYIKRGPSVGSEQQAGRPAIIVSNDQGNTYSGTAEIVYLTTAPKTDLPTHVTIRSTLKQSTALCEQIQTVDGSRIGDYIATCTDQEMSLIDAALMISLGIDAPEPIVKTVEVVKEVPTEIIKEVPVEVVKETPDAPAMNAELIAARAQLQQLQTMYNDLLRHSIPAANAAPEPRRTRNSYDREIEQMNALAKKGAIGENIKFTYADRTTAANVAKTLRNHTCLGDHLKVGYRGNTVFIEKTK